MSGEEVQETPEYERVGEEGSGGVRKKRMGTKGDVKRQQARYYKRNRGKRLAYQTKYREEKKRLKKMGRE